ncbi:outer membrane transport energization protein ExbD [Stanieria cyanosphaera PCC 7437]|uniref:Outer membrane transport energization protein ExbD n=1 Tax=Stanieria cyanosphaera (strain ATCC 29371 / PCC 7437) TaxID=111780 RepID=K9XWZ2_STAC7|nr:biopolymer transporter ExbD [Stanieria cyanosphaera]AFZ36187.1 outer membrane transport energization protein ExbD [Stanieria cyanosphaera PCC 7437]
MRLPNEPEEQFEINILPMIDVIFSILAFFIISTLFLSRSQSLPVNLPSAQTSAAEKPEQVNITIEADGDLFIDRQPIEMNQLKDALSQKIAPNSESLVVINADEKVEHGIVVKVMDNLRQIPGARMAIATEQE